MREGAESEQEERFGSAVGTLGPAVLGGLEALEWALRRLHPPAIGSLRAALAVPRDRLEAALEEFQATSVPEALTGFKQQLGEAAALAAQALVSFVDSGPPAQGVARILGAMGQQARAQAALFPLRHALSPVSRFFVEEAFYERLAELDPDPPTGAEVGLFNAANGTQQRGGFTLYVPESYDGSSDWPLVVALHGGSGHGAEFLWTWLREARGRRFLLLAPTSVGATWSLHAPPIDTRSLGAMVAAVSERWRVDASRVLLTGLSDGATFSLLCGLAEASPFTALAPVSGVLHPGNFANGNMERARGKRVWLVHGALDWMFPIGVARAAAEALEEAGADLSFREIGDLSHTYPREENAAILEWFDPGLAAPDEPQGPGANP